MKGYEYLKRKDKRNSSKRQKSREHKLNKFKAMEKMALNDILYFFISNEKDDGLKTDRLKILELFKRVHFVMTDKSISPDVRVADCGNLIEGKPYGNLEIIFSDDSTDDPNVYGIDISLRGKLSEIEGVPGGLSGTGLNL